jgi:hypothetical protein
LDLWSALDAGDNVSIGIQWIPSDCLGNGDSLSGESLALSYTIGVRIPESILGSCHSPNADEKVKPPEEKITSGRKKIMVA